MSVMFRNRKACRCLATWLPVYEAELLRRGVIMHNIDIYQLIGSNPKSAGTHKRDPPNSRTSAATADPPTRAASGCASRAVVGTWR